MQTYIINVKVDALEKDSFKLRPANEWEGREKEKVGHSKETRTTEIQQTRHYTSDSGTVWLGME